MIDQMSYRAAHMRPLVGVLLLAGLLIAGRAALATHKYEHDLAKPDTKCELCEVSHVFKGKLVQGSTAHADAVVVIPRSSVARPMPQVFLHTPYWSRAPPALPI